MGYGAGLTSGQAMRSPRLGELLSLGEGEEAVCCVNVGSVSKSKPSRPRPVLASLVSTLRAVCPSKN